MSGKPTFVVTNPLHYVYFLHTNPGVGRIIASTHGMLSDSANQLDFQQPTTFYDVPNTVDALIDADSDPKAEYIVWKPTNTAFSTVGPEYHLAQQLEDKQSIREILPASLFPEFLTLASADYCQASYRTICDQVGMTEFVAQIARSTGGKGTFVIRTEADFTASLKPIQLSGQNIVVSRFMAGQSYGIQCLLIGGAAHMTGWWHKDLVAVPGVCNLKELNASRYCGAVLENIPDDYIAQVDALVRQVSEHLNNVGYEGIFGIDIVVEPLKKVIYLIEVNPRFTAVTHLYATAMQAVGHDDFVSRFLQFSISGEQGGPQKHQRLLSSYYYLKLQNLSDRTVSLGSQAVLGIYDDTFDYQRFGWGIDRLESESEFVLIPETNIGRERKSGDRLISIIGGGDPIQDGVLNSDTLAKINRITDRFFEG